MLEEWAAVVVWVAERRIFAFVFDVDHWLVVIVVWENKLWDTFMNMDNKLMIFFIWKQKKDKKKLQRQGGERNQ